MPHNQRKRDRKRCGRVSGNLDPLQDLAPDRTLDACRLCAANVETKHCVQSGLCSFDQTLLQPVQDNAQSIAGILTLPMMVMGARALHLSFIYLAQVPTKREPRLRSRNSTPAI